MRERCLTFRCTLLEDLHSGSGVGRLKTIDDCHARDVLGRPVVWYSMVAGLLRDASDELNELNHPLASVERIARLFGAEGRTSRSSLVCRSLHFHEKNGSTGVVVVADTASWFINVMSTARELHSRRPLDQTLRTIEYARGDLIADGQLRFQGDDDDDEKLLRLCLKRLTALGGGRTRGAGRIQIDEVKTSALPVRPATLLPPRTDRRLRLVLKNLEPLCIPATAFPGNILNTESYLPGQTLRGAILTAIGASGIVRAEQRELLANPEVTQFTNAYFVPTDMHKSASNLKNLISIPLPSTAEEVKATEQSVASQSIPWWAQEGETHKHWPRKGKEDDTLWKEKESAHAPAEELTSSFKRVKAEDYLVTADGTAWQRVRPAIVTLMRNRTPVRRQDRDFDSRRQRDAYDERDLSKADLFSEVVLAEEQLFVMEIQFASDEAAKAFEAAAACLLAKDENERAWLRVGRGGRPVRIEQAEWIADAQPQRWAPPRNRFPNAFSLTLTSDLIARTRQLNFLTRLDAERLVELLGLDSTLAKQIKIDDRASKLETRAVHGFNTAARARRAAAVAIKRGSAMRISPIGADAAAMQNLFAALAALEASGKGLGERTQEGFGRFALNHPAHVLPPIDDQGDIPVGTRQMAESTTEGSAAPPVTRGAKREQVIGKVLDVVKTWKFSDDLPSRSQWQTLRHDVEAINVTQDPNSLAEGQSIQKIDKTLGELASRSKTLSGRMWACRVVGKELHATIKEQCDRFPTAAERQIFLIYLCRWVVAQLDRQAEPNRRRERGESKCQPSPNSTER